MAKSGIKINANFRKATLKNKSIISKINTKINPIMQKYKKLMLDRAKSTHKYKNRTGNLTRNHRARYYQNTHRIVLDNPTYYGVYVQSHYKNTWIENAVRYYSKPLKEELLNLPNKYSKYFK